MYSTDSADTQNVLGNTLHRGQMTQQQADLKLSFCLSEGVHAFGDLPVYPALQTPKHLLCLHTCSTHDQRIIIVATSDADNVHSARPDKLTHSPYEDLRGKCTFCKLICLVHVSLNPTP